MGWRKTLLFVIAADALRLQLAHGAGIPFAATYDASITSDPNAAAIEATLTAAMAQISGTLAATGTLNSSHPVAIEFQEMTSGISSNSSAYYNIPYSSYRNALVSLQSSSFDAAAVLSLPNTPNNPVDNSSPISVNTALIRELGFSASLYPNGGQDAVISLNISRMNLSRSGTQDAGKYDLQSATEHEIDEVLGLGSGLQHSPATVTPEDLFRYNAAGVRSVTRSGDNAYFSVNGTTNLVRFNQNSGGDYGDWWSSTKPAIPRVQDAFGYTGTQPNYGVEAIALDAIGYTLTSAAHLSLGGVNFSNMSLTAPADFSATDFTSANLSSALFTSTTLAGANMTSANCTGTNFASANCASANFSSATLTNANLTGAILTNVNFNAATYAGANISAADLRGATHFIATGLTQTNTVLPDGTLNDPAINGTNLILGTSSIPVRATGAPLTISPDSYFDIGNNSVILQNGTTLSAVQNDIATGQIRSSAGLSNMAVGAVSGAQYLAATGMGTFGGVSVNPGDVLIRYTLLGDANLDGQISADDYLLIDAAYLSGISVPGWYDGDFDGSGTVTEADYALMDAAYAAQSGMDADGIIAGHLAQFGQTYADAPASDSPLPEPGSLLLMGAGGVAILFHKDRRIQI